MPPMKRATICTASPTDLSSVVFVVLKPMSRMMMVENELTTPLGIALERDQGRSAIDHMGGASSCSNVRSKDADEEQNRLRVQEPQLDLLLVKRLVLDTRLVAGDALDGDEALALAEPGCRGRGVGQHEPNDKGPDAGGTAELRESPRLVHSVLLGVVSRRVRVVQCRR